MTLDTASAFAPKVKFAGSSDVAEVSLESSGRAGWLGSAADRHRYRARQAPGKLYIQLIKSMHTFEGTCLHA